MYICTHTGMSPLAQVFQKQSINVDFTNLS